MWNLLIFICWELIPIVESLFGVGGGTSDIICGLNQALTVPFYDLWWGWMFGAAWDEVGQSTYSSNHKVGEGTLGDMKEAS